MPENIKNAITNLEGLRQNIEELSSTVIDHNTVDEVAIDLTVSSRAYIEALDFAIEKLKEN